MKIAIVGTHGTGKSTLSYLLASHYKKNGSNVKIIQETARSCPFPINNGMTKESALWIYHEHARKELEAESKFDVVVCDRSAFDSFVYAEHFNLGIPSLYDDMALHHLESYDKLIYVRPDIPLQSDGIRSPDLQFQSSIDDIFFDLMATIEHVELKSSQIFCEKESWKQYCF